MNNTVLVLNIILQTNKFKQVYCFKLYIHIS